VWTGGVGWGAVTLLGALALSYGAALPSRTRVAEDLGPGAVDLWT
jgi:hypothetical protein